MQWNKVQVTNTVRFYNATKEKFKLIVDNKQYRFAPEGYADIPADLAQLVYEQYKYKGIFPMADGMDFETEKRQALLNYVEMGLTTNIENYNRAIEERKVAGMVFNEEPRILTMWKRVKSEILQLLNATQPVYEEPSYLAPKVEEKKKGKFEEAAAH